VNAPSPVDRAAIDHVPVMVEEIVELLRSRRPSVVFDGTVGLGGHARAILSALPEVRHYVGTDVDDEALTRARTNLASFGDRVRLFHGSYENVEHFVAEAAVGAPDAVLVDFGASTLQLRDGRRGFSFSQAGPLDMRMDPRRPMTAADILRTGSAERLQEIFSTYGEFRFSKTLARALAGAAEKPTDTVSLRLFVERVLPRAFVRGRRINPATQVFQALRIAVNDELGAIERALPRLFAVLASGGLFLAISFHSLEDRLVKNFFNDGLGRCRCPKDLPACVCGAAPVLSLVTKRPLTASITEVAANPPSRSAKLRVARKR